MKFLKQILNVDKMYLLAILLGVFFFSEAYAKLHELQFGLRSMLPRAIKLIVLSFFMSYILYHQTRNFVFWVLIPVVFYALGQVFLANSFSGNSLITLGKYLYPVLLYGYLNERLKNGQQMPFPFKWFEGIMILNSLIAIIGFLFKIRYFETYDGPRFGYNGLLLTSATSTYVYILTISYYLLDHRKSIKKFGFWIVLLAALLVGTKALYFSICLIVIFLLFKFVKGHYKYVIAFIGILAFGGLFYIIFYKVGMFVELRKNHGLLDAVLSYRSTLLLNDTLPDIKANWHFINYLFGGVSNIELRSEMSLIDLCYFFGLIGGFYYLVIYVKSFLSHKEILKLAWPFLLTLTFIFLLAGNFFFYATVPIYMAIFREAIMEKSLRLSRI